MYLRTTTRRNLKQVCLLLCLLVLLTPRLELSIPQLAVLF